MICCTNCVWNYLCILNSCAFLRETQDCLGTGEPRGSRAWSGLQVTRAEKVKQEPKDNQWVLPVTDGWINALFHRCFCSLLTFRQAAEKWLYNKKSLLFSHIRIQKAHNIIPRELLSVFVLFSKYSFRGLDGQSCQAVMGFYNVWDRHLYHPPPPPQPSIWCNKWSGWDLKLKYSAC